MVNFSGTFKRKINCKKKKKGSDLIEPVIIYSTFLVYFFFLLFSLGSNLIRSYSQDGTCAED